MSIGNLRVNIQWKFNYMLNCKLKHPGNCLQKIVPVLFSLFHK